MNCPHCGTEYGLTAHVCADNERWTKEEKDQWRVQAKARHPEVQFVRHFISESLPQQERQ